jgi:hypothetical protein
MALLICCWDLLHLDKKHQQGRNDKHGKDGRQGKPAEYYAPKASVQFRTGAGKQYERKHAENSL